MGTKQCSKCLEELTLDNFYVDKRTSKHVAVCRPCERIRSKKRYCPDEGRARHYKYRYGISVEDYENKIEAQDNKCGLCEKPFDKGKRRPHMDHCHNTGKVRDVLCCSCNTGIGKFNDDITFLQKAIDYLRRHHG